MRVFRLEKDTDEPVAEPAAGSILGDIPVDFGLKDDM
jgi:hypothetical protein